MNKTKANLKKFAKVAAVAGLAVAAAMGAMVKNTLKNIDAQAKLAQSLGTTVASMQTLERAGELAGVSMGSIEQATKDLTRRLSQAAAGAGPAADALNRLGLTAQGLSDLTLDKRIAAINDAIAKFIPAAEQAAVAGQLFGEEGSILMSRLDSDTIAQAAKDMQLFGVAISEADAEQIESVNDSLSRIGLLLKGVATKITIWLGPTLEWVAGKLENLVGAIKKGAIMFRHLGDIAREVYARMGTSGAILVNKLNIVWMTIQSGFMTMVGGLQQTWATFLHATADGMKDIPAMDEAFFQVKSAAIMAQSAVYATELSVVGLKTGMLDLATANATLAASNSGPLVSMAAMRAEMAALDAAMETGQLTAAEYAAALALITDPQSTSTTTTSPTGGNKSNGPTALTEMQKQLQAIGDTMQNTISAGFMSMVTGTKTVAESFKDMARQIIAKLYEVLVVQKLVGAWDSSAAAGSRGTGAVGFLMGLAGARANGGPVANGSSYLVGEKGPEIFTPQQSGTITPNHKMGGGGGGGVTIIQNNTFGNGVTRSEINTMLPKIVEASKAAVLDARRRGGSYAGAF